MNTADLLTAVFTDHESDAPDVTRTRLGIEAKLAGPSRRGPFIVATAATATAVATILAIAVAAILIRAWPGSGGQNTSLGQNSAASRTSAPVSTVGHAPVTPKPAKTFPFRPGWLPPAATFDHAEVGMGRYRLQDYTFGTVPSQIRGLTLWSDAGPLPTRLRDGGTLHSITLHGRPAVRGWSPSSRSYTVAILRPHNVVVAVLAYGWNRATAASFATHTARDMRYGTFPVPTRTH